MSTCSPQQPPTSLHFSLDLSICIVLFRQLNSQRSFQPSKSRRVLRSGLSIPCFDCPGEFQTQLLYRQKEKKRQQGDTGHIHIHTKASIRLSSAMLCLHRVTLTFPPKVDLEQPVHQSPKCIRKSKNMQNLQRKAPSPWAI